MLAIFTYLITGTFIFHMTDLLHRIYSIHIRSAKAKTFSIIASGTVYI